VCKIATLYSGYLISPSPLSLSSYAHTHSLFVPFFRFLFVRTSGDLISPSPLSLASYPHPEEGTLEKTLNGRQMIAAMNALNLDFATLGNHEFDKPPDKSPSQARLEQRLSESTSQ
jgi:hypothetical protein